MKSNKAVRNLAKENHVFLWQIANRLGVSEQTLNRWLRTPLSPEKERAVMAAIVDLGKEVVS